MLQRTQQAAVERARDTAPKPATRRPHTSHTGNQAQLWRLAAKKAPGVIRMPEPATREATTQTADSNLILQRKCACGGSTAGPQGECEECSKRKMGLQTKLRINTPGDVYEQEADRVAEQVMQGPPPAYIGHAPLRIQRITGQPTSRPDEAPTSVAQTLASPGTPLDATLQQEMEHRFGHDFSQVRLHLGSAAERSTREVNANAYTVGRDIVFGAGQFAPRSHEGRRLLAHELTHVVQQSGADATRPGRQGAAAAPASGARASGVGGIQRQANPSPDVDPVYFALFPRSGSTADLFDFAQAKAKRKRITEQDILHWAAEYVWAHTMTGGRNRLSLDLLQLHATEALHATWTAFRDSLVTIVKNGMDGDTPVFEGSPSAREHFAEWLHANWPTVISDLQDKADDYFAKELNAIESSGRLPSGADLVTDPAAIRQIESKPEKDSLRAGQDFGGGQKHLTVDDEWNGKRIKYAHGGDRGKLGEYDLYKGYLYFEVVGHEGIYFHLTEYELNTRDTFIGKTVGDVAKANRLWDILLTCMGKFFKGLSTAVAAPAQMVIDATGKLVDMVSLYVAYEAKSKFGVDIGYTYISSVCKEFDKCWDQEFYSGSCDTGRMKGDLVKGALKEAASLALPIVPMGEQAIACAKGSCEDCGGVAAVFVPSLDIARALERESPVKLKAGSEPPKSSEGQPSPGAEGHAGPSELGTGGETKPSEGEGKAGAAGEKRKTGDHPEPPKEPTRTTEGARTEEIVRSEAEHAGSEVQIGGEKHAVGAYGRGEFGGFQLCSQCGRLAEKLAELEKILPKDSDLALDVAFLKKKAEGYDRAYRKGELKGPVVEQAARDLAAELRKNITKDPFTQELLQMSTEDLRKNRSTLKKQAAASPILNDTPATRAARSDLKAMDERNAASLAAVKADRRSAAAVERAFGDDLTSSTPGKTSNTTAPGWDPLSQDIGPNIDETAAVGEPDSPRRKISDAERRERALSLDDREFKDAVTNQKTKGVGVDPRDAARPRKRRVSLRRNPSALWTHRFGEITEIAIIGERIKKGMKGRDTRRPGDLKAELNRKLWEEFKNPTSSEGRAVAEALENSGYGFVEVNGRAVLRELSARELHARGLRYIKGRGWVRLR